MPYDPAAHHRRSIRLREYDYSAAGAYFVTICAHQRRSLFGEIETGQMNLSPAGQMVNETWADLRSRYPHCGIDSFMVMPNHLHGIIILDGTVRGDSERSAASISRRENRFAGTEEGSLARIIQAFKSITTNHYIRCVRNMNWPPFDRHVWQPNYFEHVIRNEKALFAIRHYIGSNPQRWEMDAENPNGNGTDKFEAWVEQLNDPLTAGVES